MKKEKKAYQVVRSLPDNLGAIMIGGSTYEPGSLIPLNAPAKIIEDYLEREMIEEAPIEAVEAVTTAKPKESTPVDPELRKRLRPVSKWALNPADLVGKNIKQLNIMILEKDSDAEPFDSLEDAVEYLSRDFEG